jgi:hypothetical protein
MTRGRLAEPSRRREGSTWTHHRYDLDRLDSLVGGR